MSSAEIHHLLHQDGLAVVFAAVALQALGAPLPGTTVLIAAAVYAAATHALPIAGIIAGGTLGALAGTTAGFGLGRWGGEGLLLWIGRRLRRRPAAVQRLRPEIAAHGAGWLFVARFVTGLRNVSGLVAGASGMPVWRFVPVSAAAALAWATLNALEYYWFGRILAGADTWVQVVLVCLGIAWMGLSLRLLRRRALRRLSPQRDAGTARPT